MNSFFKLKEIQEEERLPEIFAKARLGTGLSFSDIERKTKIRAKYLEALENGRYDKLPAEVYVRGFLKTYCRLLGLDYGTIIQMYRREVGIQKSVKQIEEPQMPKPIHSPKIIITPKTFFLLGIGLAFALGAIYIWYQFSNFTAPPNLTVNYPGDNLKVTNSSIVVEGATDEGAELFINGQSIGVNPDGSFKSLISLQNGINLIKFSAKNKVGKETVIERQVVAEFALAHNNEETNTKASENTTKTYENLELQVKIGPNSAWLHIESDGKIAYDGVMLPNTNQVFEAEEEIIITTGNAGSTSIIFNGQSMGKLGNEGEVRRGIKFNKNTKSIN